MKGRIGDDNWLALATRRLLEILRAEDARLVTLAATEPGEPRPTAVPITVADVTDVIPPPPPWISRLQQAAEDGVAESLRASIREEGWALMPAAAWTPSRAL
jgi:hypothetical protein